MADDIQKAEEARQGCRPSLVNKKFLNSNSTSHEWMFGAIAEILDNANDPDVLANQFWIDIEIIGKETCLVLTDNGKGMDNETLYRMLSFGFSDKQVVNGHHPIGRYGNGFKSGSMRLAKDAIVFTKQHKKTMSVGMLSQTYLDKIKCETVVVPIVSWDACDATIEYPPTSEKKSLEEILKYSIFKDENELMHQFFQIPGRGVRHQGTRIVLYNLAKDKDGELELDLDSDPNDILIPTLSLELNLILDKNKCKSVSKYRTSLRKYISILYLRPRMQVFLKKKKVTSICMLKCLTNKKKSSYSPKVSKEPIKIEFGLNPEKDEYGIVIYHRNRLIQPFRKNNFMKKLLPENLTYNQIREIIEQAVGVVELNCVTPNHIKQNFQDDSVFRNIEQNLLSRLWDYCLDIVETNEARDEDSDLWVQCTYPECQKWRRLPHGIKKDQLPGEWFCMMNPDKTRNFCDAEEEQEDDDEIQKLKRKTLGINEGASTSIAAVAAVQVEEEEDNRREMSLAPEMIGLVDKILSSPHEPPRKKRRHLKARRGTEFTVTATTTQPSSYSSTITVSASGTTPVKLPIQMSQQNKDPISLPVGVKSENYSVASQEIPPAIDYDAEIRRLRTELDSRQARIAELEQQLEKKSVAKHEDDEVVVIHDTDQQRVEELVTTYLRLLWPDFKPGECTIVEALEILLDQAKSYQLANRP